MNKQILVLRQVAGSQGGKEGVYALREPEGVHRAGLGPKNDALSAESACLWHSYPSVTIG
ncbi:MAG: hypothetical protein V1736_09675 [Pseudomonadota bacterium]